MDKFVELLEVQIPYIFKGASEKLKNQDHIRVTNHKDPVSEETKDGFIHFHIFKSYNWTSKWNDERLLL